MDPAAKYEIDIAGRRFPVVPHVNPIAIPMDTKKHYIPTPVITYQSELSQ